MTQYSGPPPSAANLQTYASAIANSWNTNVASLCPAPIVLATIVVTDLNSNSGAQAVVPAVHPGTRGDEMIGANTAMLVSYPVSLRYRGGHPRSYLLVGGFADIDGGMMYHVAFRDEVKAHHDAFLFTLSQVVAGSTAWNQLVAVRRHGKFLPNSGAPHFVLNNPIVLPIVPNSGIYHTQAASQKGRIGRRSK
jgi:hypothetical protein